MSDDFIEKLYQRKQGMKRFPDKREVVAFLDTLFDFLFLSNGHTQQQLKESKAELEFRLTKLLSGFLQNEYEVKQHTDDFFETLPTICEHLYLDAQAIHAFDPAANSLEEILLAYPGFYAATGYRISHQLFKQRIEILPRLLSEQIHSRTGIDIHPGAEIGKSFFIDHGTGIVIGETTVIGDNVKIYQGVTLGAVNVAKEDADIKRHPTIGDNVVIYSGATLLGGKTEIGHDSIIGGNVWLTSGVPPYSVVYHKSEIVIRDNKALPDVLNFVI